MCKIYREIRLALRVCINRIDLSSSRQPCEGVRQRSFSLREYEPLIRGWIFLHKFFSGVALLVRAGAFDISIAQLSNTTSLIKSATVEKRNVRVYCTRQYFRKDHRIEECRRDPRHPRGSVIDLHEAVRCENWIADELQCYQTEGWH